MFGNGIVPTRYNSENVKNKRLDSNPTRISRKVPSFFPVMPGGVIGVGCSGCPGVHSHFF